MKPWSDRLVGVNDEGRRVGESNPNSKLSDHEVDLLLGLHSEGWGYRRLAKKFEIGRTQVRRIVAGKNRAQFATRFKGKP